MNAAAPAMRGDVAIRINERPASFLLRAAGVHRDVVYQMAPRTFDLLLIASSVFVADARVARGGPTRADLGSDWSRDFRLVVPVSDPGFWRSVRDALQTTLGFLSGDRFDFTFVPRSHKMPRQQALAFDQGRRVDEVILFSGGLDSLTGTFELLRTTDAKLLLVTHRSASKTATFQTALVQDLQVRFPGRITWVPALGRLLDGDARETTQRSRSFLYACLGYAAASLVGLSKLRFYENGIVSLNLPINRQVIGTMATRTTHSLFLHRLEGLLSQIAGHRVSVDNPYAWLTKTQVVERLRDLDGADLIARTTSCSSVRKRTRQHPHCGCCSQCLDRRFATLAAGVESFDPVDRYEVELFGGSRGREQDRTMALDWTRHAARRLATMSFEDFATRFAAELADLAAGNPGRQPQGVLADAFHLHRRHGEVVRRAVKTAIEDHTDSVLDSTVSPTSLMAALLASASEPALRETSFAPGAVQPGSIPDGSSSIFPLRLVFDPDRGPHLRIIGLGEFQGAHFGLVRNLKPWHDEDCAKQLTPESHRYVAAGRLGSKETTRQHAKRCRDELADTYESIEGTRPADPLLIHSKNPGGYRLDPEARFFDAPDDGNNGHVK